MAEGFEEMELHAMEERILLAFALNDVRRMVSSELVAAVRIWDDPTRQRFTKALERMRGAGALTFHKWTVGDCSLPVVALAATTVVPRERAIELRTRMKVSRDWKEAVPRRWLSVPA